MKSIKKAIIALLLILGTIVIGGLIKYNFGLNKFIKQESNECPKSENRPKVIGTEVHILGTVHFETDSIKRLDLYHFIDSISPSIILYESDAKTVKRILRKRDYFFQLLNVFTNRAKTEMEKPVVLKYIENNPHCVVLPYEWEIRNQYHRKHKIRSKPKGMIQSIIELNNENLLTNDQSNIISRYLALSRELNKIGQYGTLVDINSLATDSIVKERQYYQYTKITEIVNDRKELAEYLDFAQIFMNYWDIRNKAMAQNILKQVKLNSNKVIVVLNGFYHRYYLVDELKKYEAEFGFSIKGI